MIISSTLKATHTTTRFSVAAKQTLRFLPLKIKLHEVESLMSKANVQKPNTPHLAVIPFPMSTAVSILLSRL